MPEQGNPPGWTFETLKKYLDARFEAQQAAILKTEKQIDDRFTSVNEFRAALSDLTNTMMPRQEYNIKHEALSDRVTLNDKRIEDINVTVKELLAKEAAQQQGLGLVGSVIAGMISAVSVVVAALTLYFKR